MLKDLASGIQHVGIPTIDINKTVDFYQGLGFDLAFSTTDDSGNLDVAFLKLKNLVIETYQEGTELSQTGSINHIAIDVNDVEEVFKKLMEKNYDILDKEINFLPFWQNGVKFFTIKGPNNEQIEFSEML
ncbi:catechol 2,3-dioxygenase-like lactoylglutathione lyase family enzyme [Halanaerobium saccharolyticum]|uniref:Catechol 2,3-dioxygenase-like lactoylglutathione lyase family enzyme n=1 Tax=Halanaerobium saccharolyticum TaxID=43595 RepID=A0A4R6LQI2_9FIRM|nr:VOC family protein [Halanaerobium saccharolyticum]TDO86100.1 catechol 2,3-dioxygenase-like lactoylglutathione lyase family enzyme [Halanaerobium saccharolyticum]